MQLKNPVRMVVCDLDGTLLDGKSQVTETTRKAIRNLRRQGILFGICTGRPANALDHLLKHWKIENDVDFVLGFNGGMMLNLEDGTTASWKQLPGSVMKDIAKAFDGYNVAFCQYQGKCLKTTKKNFVTAQMARRNHIPLEVVPFSALEQDNPKMMAVGMPWVISKWLKEHPEGLPGLARVFRSGPFLLEIVHPELSKLTGVEKACWRFNIPIENVLSFGNDNNDLEMLQGTMGVAMENGLSSIKNAAMYTCPSNLQNGVAVFLNDNVLNQKI